VINRIIQRRTEDARAAILGHYRDRYLGHAVLVPSARFGLYAAAKELLSAGDKVLISPITCRTVISALLAGGVRPVFTNIELETGNIDISKLNRETLRSAQAIVTTNLYGNPDRAADLQQIARRYGLLLIEDCAHVIDTKTGGQAIGSFGDVAVFSFKKYFDEPGGVLAVRSDESARALFERIGRETTPPPIFEERARFLQFVLGQAGATAITSGAAALYRLRARRRTSAKPDSGGAGGGHNIFAGSRPLGTMPTAASLLRVEGILARWEALVRERNAAAAELVARCPLVLKRSRHAETVSYLVVPFFCHKRDDVVARLRERGTPTYFLYSPPMNQSFGHCVPESGLNTELIDEWSRNILPIPPQFAKEYIEVIGSLYGQNENRLEKSA
jgi:dTDP-4-amino-4,6-dideoxygalactose transaminase